MFDGYGIAPEEAVDAFGFLLVNEYRTVSFGTPEERVAWGLNPLVCADRQTSKNGTKEQHRHKQENQKVVKSFHIHCSLILALSVYAIIPQSLTLAFHFSVTNPPARA